MEKRPTHHGGTVRILVADDFEAWRIKVREILGERQDWHIIFETCDGLEAVRKSLELRPDNVLLDIGMPGLNGIEAAKRIRTASPNTKVIFVTQNTENEVRSAALATGADAYVVKSESASRLIPAIAAALCSKPI
jgi:DNA-binding NarL/FixJ family response regulator